MIRETFMTSSHREMKAYFLNELKGLGTLRVFEKNENINPNKYMGCFKVVIKGMIKISLISVNGESRLFHLIRKGEVYDEYGMYEQDEIEIVAKETSKVLFFKFEDIYKLENPLKCMEYLLQSMHRKYSLLKFQALCVQFDDIDGQIASVILRTAYQSGCTKEDNRYELDYPFTHDEMANIIGCSRVTITRHIQKLRDEGVIDFNKRLIVINDIAALEEYTHVK